MSQTEYTKKGAAITKHKCMYQSCCKSLYKNEQHILWQSNQSNKRCFHQNAVDDLARTLQKEYQILQKNIEYRSAGRVVGEIDILAYRNGEFHLYELKTGREKNKEAKEQLLRAKDMLGLNARLFYVHVPGKDYSLNGEHGNYVVKEILNS